VLEIDPLLLFNIIICLLSPYYFFTLGRYIFISVSSSGIGIGVGGNGNNQWEWDGNWNENKAKGVGMGMSHWEWEGMRLKTHSCSRPTAYELLQCSG